jgi:hypothetical protein
VKDQKLRAGSRIDHALEAGLDPTPPSHGDQRLKVSSCICVGGFRKILGSSLGYDAALGQMTPIILFTFQKRSNHKQDIQGMIDKYV